MKKEDAKNKWCPFARIPGFVQSPIMRAWVVANRSEDNSFLPNGTACLGDECACWVAETNDGEYGSCGLARYNGQ